MTPKNKEKIQQAGKIASQVKTYIKPLIKKDVLLLDIANKIETKIIELGGKPAFPTNLSINDIAAHYTPGHNDETLAHGLLKIDFGVHLKGWVADTAFSIDLENSETNKKLIRAAEEGLNSAINALKNNPQITLNEIGASIHKEIEKYNFAPIINLSGHSIDQYELHSGITIPNFDNHREEVLPEGTYAIEPFSTTGSGKVYDGKASGIYNLIDEKLPRSTKAREVLAFIMEEYQSLPFCSRWIVAKFGTTAMFVLRQLKEMGNIHEFEQLVEASHEPVAQAEHTLIIEKDRNIIITTE